MLIQNVTYATINIKVLWDKDDAAWSTECHCKRYLSSSLSSNILSSDKYTISTMFKPCERGA